MLQITERLASSNDELHATLSLPFYQREKCRQLVDLDNGEQAGLVLPRGTTLKHGDILLADSGELIGVCAEPEAVSVVYCEQGLLFSRACYHLGNRHVPLQIGDGWLRYGVDHVLDDMLSQLGLKVEHAHLPFEPESGAYQGHAHGK